MSAMDAFCVTRTMHFQEPANKQSAISFLLCVWIVAGIHGRWCDCVGAKGKGLLPSAGCLGVQLVLIMQPDDGWAFCSEPVALHGWYMGGIASFWLNMFKNTELVRGPWCSFARVIGQAFLQSGHLWLWRRVSAVYGRMAGSVFFYVEGLVFFAACRVDAVWWDTRVGGHLACARAIYHARSL